MRSCSRWRVCGDSPKSHRSAWSSTWTASCPGQGALALQGRAGDERAGRAAAAITDPDTFACLRAERSLARGLQASCHTPLGALAQPIADRALLLRAWVGLPDGSPW